MSFLESKCVLGQKIELLVGTWDILPTILTLTKVGMSNIKQVWVIVPISILSVLLRKLIHQSQVSRVNFYSSINFEKLS